MNRVMKLILAVTIIVAQTFVIHVSTAQSQVMNVVDFDITPIIQCSDFTLDDDELFICGLFQPFVIDMLLEAEETIDQIMVGYRDDLPPFFRNRLAEPIVVFFDYNPDRAGDGPGGVLAVGSPYFEDPANPFDDEFGIVTQISNPFIRARFPRRDWAMSRAGLVSIDIEDMPFLVLTDTLVEVIVHEVFHALGNPSLFEICGLNASTNIFGQLNFIGDPLGFDGAGFGLSEFRAESGNPFAQFIPLSQNDTTGPGAHLSMFEPTFNRPEDLLQEVFLPIAPPPNVRAFMSHSLRGMFADLGFLIRGVNSPGIIDLDLDGIDDDPLIVNPALPTDP